MTFSYTLNQEDMYRGQYETRAEAIAAGIEDAKGISEAGDVVYTGQNLEPLDITDYLPNMYAALSNEVESGDNPDDEFLEDATPEAYEELQAEMEKTLKAWAEKHNIFPKHHGVTFIEEYVLTENDIAE